jgi:WD40 repeat protein
MYDSEDFFSPEKIDERLDRAPLLPVGHDDPQAYALTSSNLLLIYDLHALYSAEEARNVRSLQRVWERLAERRAGIQQHTECAPSAGLRHLRLLTPRENEWCMAARRSRHQASLRTPALAATLFLAIMVGSLLMIVHFTRLTHSSGSTAGTRAHPTISTFATPGPGYPYPTPGQNIARSPASPDGFPALAWSPNGQRLVTSTQGKVWLWDLATGSYIPIFVASTPGEKILALAWSPDGRYLAVGSNLIQVIDPASGRQLWSYSADYPYLADPGQPTRTTALAWSPDGRHLAMATRHLDKRCFVNIWNVQSRAPGHSFPDTLCAGSISSISWSSDNRYVASADGQQIQAWDAQSGYGIFQHTISAATTVSWSPSATNAGELAFADHGTSEIWNVWTDQLVHSYSSTPNGVLAWAPDGEYLATASGHRVIIYDVHDGLPVYIYTGQAHAIASLVWSPDGESLASGESEIGENNTARVWSA